MKKLLLTALMGICLSGIGYAKEMPNKASKEVMAEPAEIVEEEKPLTKSQSFKKAFGMGEYSRRGITAAQLTGAEVEITESQILAVTAANNTGVVKARDGVTTFTPYRYGSNPK